MESSMVNEFSLRGDVERYWLKLYDYISELQVEKFKYTPQWEGIVGRETWGLKKKNL